MYYNQVFSAQKKAEGIYNYDSDNLAESIITEYDNYVAGINTSSNTLPHLYNGLVVGYVQSGKTMNFCHVINRAIDDGFQLVVVMSSNKNDLNLQTTDRLADDIVGFVNPSVHTISNFQDFLAFHSNGKQLAGIALSSAVHPNYQGQYQFSGSNITKRSPEIYWLTACDKGGLNPKRLVDFSITNDNFDKFYNHDPKGCFVAVVKKNTTRLTLLHDFLAKSSVIQQHKIKALFIDDECDEITVSGHTNPLGKGSQNIGDIQKLFETTPSDPCHSLYVSYTATPVANICVKNRNNTNIGFPDDFIKIMNKGAGYCGFEAYKEYEQIIQVIDPGQSNEVDNIQGLVNGQHLWADYQNATPVLFSAILQYAWNCKIFEERGLCNNSMLVHTSSRKVNHGVLKQYIEDLLCAVSDELLNELDNVYNNGNYYTSGTSQAAQYPLISELNNIYIDIQRKMVLCNRNGYYNRPEFKKCGVNEYPNRNQFSLAFLNDILNYIMPNGMVSGKSYNPSIKLNPDANKILVLEVNSNNQNLLPAGKNYIAVGGNKISRGLTLENLSVTYFTRSTMAIDTLTQMARWFGYRIGYFDICRLYIDDYSDIDEASNVEKQLHEQIINQTKKGLRAEDMHLYLVKNKINNKILSNKQALQTYTYGKDSIIVFEAEYFYWSLNKTQKNRSYIDDFFNELKADNRLPEPSGNYGWLRVLPNAGGTANTNRTWTCYVKDVDYVHIKKLFNDYMAVSDKNPKKHNPYLLAVEYLNAIGFNGKVNVLISGRQSNSSNYPVGCSFADDVYKVSGKAIKQTVSNSNRSFQINKFGDSPEDLLVDYPTPQTLDADFKSLTNGTAFSTQRSAGYAEACRKLGESKRTQPLLIITPFEVKGDKNNNTYLSMRLIIPGSMKQCTVNII